MNGKIAWRSLGFAIAMLVVVALLLRVVGDGSRDLAVTKAVAGAALGAGLARLTAPLFKNPVVSVELVLDFVLWAATVLAVIAQFPRLGWGFVAPEVIVFFLGAAGLWLTRRRAASRERLRERRVDGGCLRIGNE